MTLDTEGLKGHSKSGKELSVYLLYFADVSSELTSMIVRKDAI